MVIDKRTNSICVKGKFIKRGKKNKKNDGKRGNEDNYIKSKTGITSDSSLGMKEGKNVINEIVIIRLAN